MANKISNFRSIQGLGILADRDAKTASLRFRRYNLIYGFNGSGKSTLSRLFSSLQLGSRHPALPPNSAFEVEMDGGKVLACPNKLAGLENPILTLNTDFVEQNLQWAAGRANPVFYIGKEQAETAENLARREAELRAAIAREETKVQAATAREREFTNFKRERAKLVAERLSLPGRKYEAPQLEGDYETLPFDEHSRLSQSVLDSYVQTSHLRDPLPTLAEIRLHDSQILRFLNEARTLCAKTLSTIFLDEMKNHPTMFHWIKEGHEYHKTHSLDSCLYCGNTISQERRDTLEHALDDQLRQFTLAIEQAAAEIDSELKIVTNLPRDFPNSNNLSVELQSDYQSACKQLSAAAEALKEMLTRAKNILNEKRQRPALSVDTSMLSTETAASDAVKRIRMACDDVNTEIGKHNKYSSDFSIHQDQVRTAIRCHSLAEGKEEYTALRRAATLAREEADAARLAIAKLTSEVDEQKRRIMEHGPAADQINKLIHSYLGHNELSISPTQDGYELHRHKKRIEGFPSEGEKTAIAVCYFLLTLESEGRQLKDLVIVVDDPVSSLDTKALNFACSLLRSRLEDAAQLFILTHNQNCMNEFRKAWKGRAKPPEGKEPTAGFYFLDVTIPKGQSYRVSTIVDMPRLIREYDSEYHYLIHHILKFSNADSNEYEYAHMIPNVLRRALDVFLAFRCPGNSGLASKIEQLCKKHEGLNKDRIKALERLAQVESHADNLDRLIEHSSMTLEETRDATTAMLAMMDIVDKDHLDSMRHLCR